MKGISEFLPARTGCDTLSFVFDFSDINAQSGMTSGCILVTFITRGKGIKHMSTRVALASFIWCTALGCMSAGRKNVTKDYTIERTNLYTLSNYKLIIILMLPLISHNEQKQCNYNEYKSTKVDKFRLILMLYNIRWLLSKRIGLKNILRKVVKQRNQGCLMHHKMLLLCGCK